MEIFGYGAALPFFIVCVSAYVFNFGKSVYDQKVYESVFVLRFILTKKESENTLKLPKRLY